MAEPSQLSRLRQRAVLRKGGENEPQARGSRLPSLLRAEGHRQRLPTPRDAAAGRPTRYPAPARQNGWVEQLTEEQRAERECELRALIDLMRPSVQADGGDLELVAFDVDSGAVEVQLRGACSSCAISSVTLQGGVDRILRSRLPWVTEVTGGVDETADPQESAALGQGAYVPKGY